MPETAAPHAESALELRLRVISHLGEVDAADWDDVAARLRQALDRK